MSKPRGTQVYIKMFCTFQKKDVNCSYIEYPEIMREEAVYCDEADSCTAADCRPGCKGKETQEPLQRVKV